MEQHAGKYSDSTFLLRVLYVLSVVLSPLRLTTRFLIQPRNRKHHSLTQRIFKHSVKAVTQERPVPETEDGVGVVLTDCPFWFESTYETCGLPSELRESFMFEGETRVVIVCPRGHVIGAGAEELGWVDFFEGCPPEITEDGDSFDAD